MKSLRLFAEIFLTTAGLLGPLWGGGIFLTAHASDSVESSGASSSPTVAGEIASISGKVQITSSNKVASPNTKKGNPGRGDKVGDFVYVGDSITTAENGQIKMLMKDQSVVDLGPSSLFKVAQFSDP